MNEENAIFMSENSVHPLYRNIDLEACVLPWAGMLAVGASHFTRRPRDVSPLLYITLFLSAISRPASAQTFLDPTLKSCGLRKAYAVGIKLLAVYASHVFTIKLPPGSRTLDTISRYVKAGLLPSSSASNSVYDVAYRRAGFTQLNSKDGPDTTIYRSMQKAINTGAVCFRVKEENVQNFSGLRRVLPNEVKVRAKPLKQGELFLLVPRGTRAQLFMPTMVEGSSQLAKALFGAIQLAFATVQLVSVNDSRVAAYGYGAFIYTIIPYAIASVINLVAALLTDNYGDFTEMELVSTRDDTHSHALDPGRENPSIVPTHEVPNAVDPHSQISGPENENHQSDAAHQEHLEFGPGLEDDHVFVVSPVVLLALVCYLAIVGGITRFHPGISTKAQRGWFVSWAVFGILCGLTTEDDSGGSTGFTRKAFRVLSACIWGVATVGGIVAMIQQYLHLFQC